MLDPLTLDQLRVLVAVADSGSFSAAARRLGRVQSAISQSIRALEVALGATLFDREGRVPKLNDAGRVLLAEARGVINGAEALKAHAESITGGVEAELTLAVDVIFPNRVLTASLKAFASAFPGLPVTVFTEAMGGADQRLREGSARLALFMPIPGVSDHWASEFLVTIPMVPVVATSHALAARRGPLSRRHLEREVQLILTDRTEATRGLTRGVISLRHWRFADLNTRLDFLLAGFGWCNMPLHMVVDHVEAGRLRILEVDEPERSGVDIHVVHERGRPPGRAGRWLVEDLRERVARCVAARPDPAEVIARLAAAANGWASATPIRQRG